MVSAWSSFTVIKNKIDATTRPGGLHRLLRPKKRRLGESKIPNSLMRLLHDLRSKNLRAFLDPAIGALGNLTCPRILGAAQPPARLVILNRTGLGSRPLLRRLLAFLVGLLLKVEVYADPAPGRGLPLCVFPSGGNGRFARLAGLLRRGFYDAVTFASLR